MVKLKLNTPPVKGYLHHAYLLSIAQEHPCFNEWFYSNYIQLRYFPKNNWLNFHILYYYLLLDVQTISYNLIRINHIDIIDFIINFINQGYYVWLYIDEYYDPNRISYNNKNLIHENMIYGYNITAKCFYTVGFDRKRIYSYNELNFSDFMNAYNAVPDNYQLKALKPDEKIKYQFNLHYVKEILGDYIFSRNSSVRNGYIENITTDCFYGMDIYKYLKIYFENVLQDNVSSDIRLLHILYEHKICMLSRIKYLSDNKYLAEASSIIKAYSEIEKIALMLRNLQLSYNSKGDKKILQRMINYIDLIADKEAGVLLKLLEKL